ncbi:MAG: ATP-binding protein [Sandaracinaceae bacterium]
MTRGLFDHLPSMAFVFRSVGGIPVLEDFNRVAQGASTIDLHQYLGDSAAEVASGIPDAVADLAACLATGEIVEREADCVVPGAPEPRRLALTYGPLPPDRVILHVRDVTDQRRIEDQLAGAQRLEAVGRLAGGAAHDFNNLLSVILTYAEFVVEDLPKDSPTRDDVTQIVHAAERAATLTKGLLAFSRKQILDPRVMDLGDILERLKPMLRGLLREDVVIQLHHGRDLGRVRVDVSQMEQVIMNLAANAGDAMPRGGTLTLETSNVVLDEDYAAQHVSVVPGPYVLLSCSDSGEGMDAETLAHVFEPFFTTKPKERGTGLGLAVVYGIVKQSGGNLWVYSEPGHGTTFKIYLPRVDEQAEGHRVKGGKPATGTETVLLVEDEDAVRAAAERILRSAGFTVLSAGDGPEAIELASRYDGKIDLLLTDVVIPTMSGRELADRLTEALPGLKVLFTSGYTDHAIVDQGVLEQGTNFIGKPFAAVDLTQRVRAVLDGDERATPRG